MRQVQERVVFERERKLVGECIREMRERIKTS